MAMSPTHSGKAAEDEITVFENDTNEHGTPYGVFVHKLFKNMV
jgi:hypothetical protein